MNHDDKKLDSLIEQAGWLEHGIKLAEANDMTKIAKAYHEHMLEKEETRLAGEIWKFLDKAGYGGDIEADFVNFHVSGKELRNLMCSIRRASDVLEQD